MFTVKIKAETFQISGMDFLNKKGFEPNKEYKTLGMVGQKLLIADEETGEMVELFPRNCLFMR